MEEQIRLAMRELEEAKREVESLRKQRDALKSNMEKNRPNSIHTSSKLNYGDESYWSDQYTQRRDSSFEWYSTLDDVRELLQDEVHRYHKEGLKNVVILLPGCGDSNFAEEMCEKVHGCFHIVGIDFSTEVIEMKNSYVQSRGLKSIEYRVGDLLKLETEGDSVYSLIIDKGTLDAVASGGASSPDQIINVAKYVREMWRVLTLDGRWIIITTLPPTFFEELVIPHLQQMGNKLSNWRNGHRSTILKPASDVGGQIFLYCLTKEADFIDTRDKSKLVKDLASTVLNTVKNLEEDEVEELKELEISDPRKAPDRLEIIHNIDLSPNPESSFVYLNIEESSFIAGAALRVRYYLAGSKWTEDDVIRLVASQRNHNLDVDDDSACYDSRIECSYEAFEFVNSPQPWQLDEGEKPSPDLSDWLKNLNNSDTIYSGILSLNLPGYGGRFHLSYLQPLPLVVPDSTQSTQQKEEIWMVKKYNRLFRTESFTISCPLFLYHPVKKSPHKQHVGRRKVIDVNTHLTTKPVQITIEQLYNIRKVHVTVHINELQAHECLQRLMMWVYPATENGHQVAILIEFDRISNHHTVTTEYVQCFIDGLDDWDGVTISSGSTELLFTPSSCTIQTRLTYDSSSSENQQLNLSSKELMDEFSLLKLLHESQLNSLKLSCRFCGQNILQPIKGGEVSVHALPSGLFNESLYDFICCEADCMTLQSESMIVPPNSLYCGLISLWINRTMIVSNSLQFTCKRSQTMEDLFSVLGSTTMTEKKSNNDLNSTFQSLINADQCAVECRRCGATLGDGKLDLTAIDSDSQENIDRSVAEGYFRWEHVERIHLLWSSIAIDFINISERSSHCVVEKSFEMIIGRICMYLMEKHNKAITCFYVPSSGINNTDQSSVSNMSVIIIKTVAKVTGYGHQNNSTTGAIQCQITKFLKATCSIGSAKKLVKGSEARIPLDVTSWQQLHYYCGRNMATGVQPQQLYFPLS